MKKWNKPSILASFTEAELLALQKDLVVDGWGLWGHGDVND